MSLTRLQDDLLNDFKQQKQVIAEQIAIFDPLAKSLRKPAAHRLMNKGIMLFAEIFFYLLCLLFIAITILMNHIYWFSPLDDINVWDKVKAFQTLSTPEYFSLSVHFLSGFIAFLFLFIARLCRKIRQKNTALSAAGKSMKVLVGQHLKRKAAIDAIEQRHFQELPDLDANPKVNEVLNPGFSEPKDVH